jgi:4-hydroxy-2-oxoheptanedioate aldolase
MNTKTNKIFVNSLKKLQKFNMTAFKQSLEDEGATFKEVIFIKKILKRININQNIKIGGCEAINDILFCKKINVDGIIAPMVESTYALKKFIQAIKFVGFSKKIYFNLETISAIKNLNKILKSEDSKYLSGIVIGRSDICGSLGLEKKDVNHVKIFNLVNNSINKIKKKKIIIKMGGSISPTSKSFIINLFNKKKLDYIETRNIEIKLTKKNIYYLDTIINNALSLELQWLQIKSIINKNNNFLVGQYKKRIKELSKRLLII